MVSSSGLGQLLKEVTPDLTYMSEAPPHAFSSWPPTPDPQPPSTSQHREFSLNEVYPVV